MKDIISLGIARNIHYCEKMAWIKVNGIAEEASTPSMELSADAHAKNLTLIADKYNLPQPIYYNKVLCHPTLPVCGAPDILAGENKRIIIEYKSFEREKENYEDFKLQLLAYAWLVQEVLGNVSRILLIVNNSIVYEAEYSYNEYKYGEYITKKLLNLKGSKPPRVDWSPKCTYCYFKNICWGLGPRDELLIV